MADIRQQYLQDHAAYMARLQAQQNATKAPAQPVSALQPNYSSLSRDPSAHGDALSGIMSLPTGASISPFASMPQPSLSVASHTDVSDQTDPTKSPVSMPDAVPSSSHKSMAAQADVGAAQRSMSQTGPQWAADNATTIPSAAAQVANPAYPANPADWSLGQKFSSAFSADDPYGALLNAQKPGGQHMPQPIAPAAPGAQVPAQLAAGMLPPVAQPNGTGQAQSGSLPPPVVTAAGPTTADPQAQAIADIQQQKALIDQIYPQRPVDQTLQNAADANAQKDNARTQALAQLAFFSGITQGAGGQWQGVGRGLAGAGQAYEQGFDRYQKVLQSKADRATGLANQQYSDQTNRSDAAVKLYQQKQSLDMQRAGVTRELFEKNQSQIDNYFKTKIQALKGNNFTPTDQAEVDKWMSKWQLSKQRNTIIDDNNDVSDK